MFNNTTVKSPAAMAALKYRLKKKDLAQALRQKVQKLKKIIKKLRIINKEAHSSSLFDESFLLTAPDLTDQPDLTDAAAPDPTDAAIDLNGEKPFKCPTLDIQEPTIDLTQIETGSPRVPTYSPESKPFPLDLINNLAQGVKCIAWQTYGECKHNDKCIFMHDRHATLDQAFGQEDRRVTFAHDAKFDQAPTSFHDEFGDTKCLICRSTDHFTERCDSYQSSNRVREAPPVEAISKMELRTQTPQQVTENRKRKTHKVIYKCLLCGRTGHLSRYCWNRDPAYNNRKRRCEARKSKGRGEVRLVNYS